MYNEDVQTEDRSPNVGCDVPGRAGDNGHMFFGESERAVAPVCIRMHFGKPEGTPATASNIGLGIIDEIICVSLCSSLRQTRFLQPYYVRTMFG